MIYDLIVIGGGIVGLANAMTMSKSGMTTLLVERHRGFGNETSSRNSEVIHAGIYYKKNSLKAIHCVSGNRMIYDWCEKYSVPHQRIGKFIISIDSTEDEELNRIYENAIGNDVTGISKYSINAFRTLEPNIKASSVLFSRDTGIVDSHSMMQSLEIVAKENDCDFAYNHKVSNIEYQNGKYLVEVEDKSGNKYTVQSRCIINSAGLDADLVAESAGIDIDKENYRINFCRGHYFRIASSKKHLANHLIYPVPKQDFHGLGIHITKELNGELKLGPDTEYLDNRIQDYSVDDNLKVKFFHAASQYINGLTIEDISPDQSGIRPKLQIQSGSARDFIINEEGNKGLPRMVNLIGIESPGLTSCLSISEYVKELIS